MRVSVVTGVDVVPSVAGKDAVRVLVSTYRVVAAVRRDIVVAVVASEHVRATTAGDVVRSGRGGVVDRHLVTFCDYGRRRKRERATSQRDGEPHCQEPRETLTGDLPLGYIAPPVNRESAIESIVPVASSRNSRPRRLPATRLA